MKPYMCHVGSCTTLSQFRGLNVVISCVLHKSNIYGLHVMNKPERYLLGNYYKYSKAFGPKMLHSVMIVQIGY